MWAGCCFSIIYNQIKAVSEYVCVSLFASSKFLLCSRFKLSGGEVLSRPQITSNMHVLWPHIWTPFLLKLNTVWSNNKTAETRELDDKSQAWCKDIWTWQAYPTHWQKKNSISLAFHQTHHATTTTASNWFSMACISPFLLVEKTTSIKKRNAGGESQRMREI